MAQDCAGRYEDRPALFFEGECVSLAWSCRDLAQASDAAAAAFNKRGFRKGDRVILALPNGPEFPAAFFGAIKAGVVPIPVSAMLKPREIAFLKKDSGAGLVLNEPVRARKLLSTPGPAVRIPQTRGDHPAFWLYTSGTEGRPKAVIHAHRSIPAHDARSRVWLDLRKTDIVFNTSALNWSYALTCGLADVLRRGAASVIFSGRPEPGRLLDVVHKRRVTIFMSVPGLYRRLVEHLEKHLDAKRSFRSVRVCLSAGEKLPAEIRARFRKATGLTIREGLGMTEHSVYLVQPRGRPVVEGSCGRALPGHRIEILREDLTRARPGEVGILASHRSCPGLMLGYHRRPKEEKAAFRKGWFLSGDLACRDEQGNYFFIGRRDDVITAGGYRISPMEVEAVLNRHPAVKGSAAVGVEIAPGKTVVRGHVILKKGRKGTGTLKRSLLDFARRNLAPYKAPRDIVFETSLPRTSTGKLIRKRFRSA